MYQVDPQKTRKYTKLPRVGIYWYIRSICQYIYTMNFNCIPKKSCILEFFIFEVKLKIQLSEWGTKTSKNSCWKIEMLVFLDEHKTGKRAERYTPLYFHAAGLVTLTQAEINSRCMHDIYTTSTPSAKLRARLGRGSQVRRDENAPNLRLPRTAAVDASG